MYRIPTRKLWLFRSVSLLLLTLLAGPALHASDPFLWEAHKDGRTSYLMGTIHSSHPDVSDLPPEVTEALAGSEVFLPELEFSLLNLGRMVAAAFRFEGTSWRDRVPEAWHDRVIEAARKAGIPEFLLHTVAFEMIPFFLAQPPGEDPTRIMDVQLYRQAAAAGARVVALESVEEQMAVFETLDEATLNQLIEEALEESEAGYPSFRRLVETYASGDEEAVLALMREYQDDLPEPFREALFEDRNRLMAERALPYLERGNAFVAVGLGHLIGPDSVIALLEAWGFTIERVGAGAKSTAP